MVVNAARVDVAPAVRALIPSIGLELRARRATRNLSRGLSTPCQSRITVERWFTSRSPSRNAELDTADAQWLAEQLRAYRRNHGSLPCVRGGGAPNWNTAEAEVWSGGRGDSASTLLVGLQGNLVALSRVVVADRSLRAANGALVRPRRKPSTDRKRIQAEWPTATASNNPERVADRRSQLRVLPVVAVGVDAGLRAVLYQFVSHAVGTRDPEHVRRYER